MKAKTIILILFLSYFIGLGNLRGQGDTLLDNEIICYSSVKFPYVLNSNFVYSNNVKSLSLDYKTFITKYDKFTNWSYDISLFNYNWVSKDKYNFNRYSHSYYINFFNYSWAFVNSILMGITTKDGSDNEKNWQYLILFPIALTNSQWNYEIYEIETGKNSLLIPSLFLSSKLDYFSNNVSWWQYKPRIGIELTELIGQKNISFPLGISLIAGVEKPFALLNGMVTQNKFTPFVGLKVILMYFK